MPKKLQDRYAAGLLALGYKEVTSRSTKFRHFQHKEKTGYSAHIFLGKAGSVRCHEVGLVSSSIVVGAKTKANILAHGDAK